MMNKVPLTTRGAQKLRDELHRLKVIDRPKVIEAIATAREHGDLKENAEYHAAREQQSFIEGRIQEIEGKISNAEIIDVSRLETGGRIVFGATVDLVNEESGYEVTYQIVGKDEADIKANLISVNSPIARALIGKSTGDIVTVVAPSGKKEYEILDVRFI